MNEIRLNIQTTIKNINKKMNINTVQECGAQPHPFPSRLMPPPPDGQRDAERSYVQTGTDGAAAHTLELCLYSFFINIINSMFVYYVCHELLVNL